MTRLALTFPTLGILFVLAQSRSDAQTARTTANQGLTAHYGWQDPTGNNGLNTISFPHATGDTTLPAASRIYNTVGDPTAGVNLPAYNGNYTLTFKLTAVTPTLGIGQNSTITAYLTTEYSTNSGSSWTGVGGTSQVTATRSTPGVTTTIQAFTVTLNFSGGGPVWIRLILRGTSSGTSSGGQVKVQDYVSSGSGTDPYAVTWFSSPESPVAVTPDGEPALMPPGAGLAAWFVVSNGKSTTRTYNYSVTCTGVATCSNAPPAQSLAAYELRDVAATVSITGAAGATGTITLRATDQSDGTNTDAGSLNVTVAPQGTRVERELCLTIAAGKSAAYECGDLLLTHVLPAVRTLNRTRAPTLLYNSQFAHPYPLVRADVTLPASDPLPDSVKAILTVNATQYSATWPGIAWGAAGQTRRTTVGFDALSFSTGLYPYTLDIHRITGASNTILVSYTGTLPIVNRSSSYFGAGWWLVGFERLFFNVPSGQVLWVGGDGSARRYDRFGTTGVDTVYLAAPLNHPDTLLHRGNGTWLRLLPGGATVTFDITGFHRYTTNRLTYITEFVPDVNGLLDSIKVATGQGLNYVFTYSGSPASLNSVSIADSGVGALRVTTLNRVADTLTITDPGLPPVKYIYTAAVANRIIARKDRRSAKWSYSYDVGYRLSTAKLGLAAGDSIIETFCAELVRGVATCSPTLVAPESAYTIFDGPRTDSADVMNFWTDTLGAVRQIRDPYGNMTVISRADPRWPALATRVQRPNGWVVAARYDGRGKLKSMTDSSLLSGSKYATSRFSWDPKWDEPTQIVTPLGEETDLSYDGTNGNRLWQQDIRGTASRVTFSYYGSGNGRALLKTVTAPGGAVDSVAYDSRGNLALTRTPMGWRTYFDNDRLGRLTVVRDSLEAGLFFRDSTFYDAENRVVRRVTAGPVRSGDSAQTVYVKTFYNAEGQLDSLQRWGIPPSPVPTVDTIGVITTRWRYDSAGRQVAEVAPDGPIDSTRYDAAGNPITIVPRRGVALSTSMVYDRMNRLVRRVVPQVTYTARNLGIATYPYFDAGCNCVSYHTYPWYSLDPSTGGPTIPSDTIRFAYDNLGNLIRADNRDAYIRRTYLLNGLLKTDTLKILTYSARDSTKNVYGIEHRYDLDGRLSILKHPRQLAPRIGTVIADSVRYAYVQANGAIDTVIDLLGNRFHPSYNYRDELTSMSMPGGITDSLIYDLDGREITNLILNGSTSPYKHPDPTLRQAAFTYIDEQRVSQVANAVGWKDTTTSTYSGLGQLHVLTYVIPSTNRLGNPARATSSETFLFDPLSNQYNAIKNSSLIVQNYGTQRSPSNQQAFRYQPHTGRWWDSFWWDATRGQYRSDTSLYDPGGDVEFTYQTFAIDASQSYAGALMENRALFYRADGKLKVSEYRDEQKQTTLPDQWDQHYTFEEFRYDALGRRVLVRTRRQECPRSLQLDLSEPCRLSTIRRTVWDGSQELYEIVMPGGDADPATTMDNDTLSLQRNLSGRHWDPNPQFGRAAYVYGAVVDQPLSVTRINLRDWPYNDSTHVWAPLDIIPEWNWRSQADYGTFGDGGIKSCITSNRCVSVGWRTSAFAYAFEPGADTLTSWMGTLIEGKEEGSGLVYRRHRYYDPQTGRFTQEDPIGLAGGLNLYGFASGDPVNLSDPFGLKPCWLNYGCRLGWLIDTFLKVHNFFVKTITSSNLAQMEQACHCKIQIGIVPSFVGPPVESELSTASATARVIGHAGEDLAHPVYLQVADAIGAKAFNISSEVWNAMSAEARWAENARFLDEGIAEGAEFVLSVPRDEIRLGSDLEKEVDYLLEHGYKWAADNRSLVPK